MQKEKTVGEKLGREETPGKEVLDCCHPHAHLGGNAPLVVTGRSDEFRDTTGWLHEQPPRGPVDAPDTTVGVKREIHAEFSRPFDVREAIDSDPLIVKMRAALGIISMLVPEIS